MAGGVSNAGAVLTSCEICDPTTGTWSPTGSLGVARSAFQMVLLPDGRILAAGGSDADGTIGNGNSVGSAEIFNAGSWVATTPLLTPRYNFQMRVLPGNKVLAAGGATSAAQALNSAELYDFTTSTWTPTGSLNASRFLFQMVLFPNGNLLAFGGFDRFGNIISTSELYMSSTWATAAPMNMQRADFQAVLLSNGNILAAGGFSDGGTMASAEVFDITTRSWTAIDDMSTPVVAFSWCCFPVMAVSLLQPAKQAKVSRPWQKSPVLRAHGPPQGPSLQPEAASRQQLSKSLNDGPARRTLSFGSLGRYTNCSISHSE